ncbi:MAG: amidase [Chloroflexota bacterium]|nr:amidase [Chloroflexota bacterium]
MAGGDRDLIPADNGRGEESAADRIEACLARYGAVESRIHAFAWLDPDRARRLGRERDGERWKGLLHGVPVGVKDIFDTAGIPTEHGSRLFAGRVPETSADAVIALEDAGAIVLGKTVTAELAFLTPGPTRNPWDLDRTPGGSSMGSAAAVAAGVVPLALGTQTNGSIIRPAAFCGIVGFKPSAGRISKAGVLEFSHTLDQVGGFTRNVPDVASLCAVLSRERLREWWSPPSAVPRLAALRTAEWEHASDAMQRRFEADVDALALAGGPIEWPEPPPDLDDAAAALRTIMAVESARSLGGAVAARPEAVSAGTREFLSRGEEITAEAYASALDERERLIDAFGAWASPYDAILTPPTTGEAPGPETTGDPRFCTRWSLVGAPAITIPTGLSPSGLPLGLQLVAAPGRDRALLAAAAWAEALRPFPARPPL